MYQSLFKILEIEQQMGESFQLHGSCVSEGKIINGRAYHRDDM